MDKALFFNAACSKVIPSVLWYAFILAPATILGEGERVGESGKGNC